MEFKIPRRDIVRLSVSNKHLKPPSSTAQAVSLRILGVNWVNGDYEIFDYSYYDCLSRNGYYASLANMISLHNAILKGEVVEP